MTRGELASSTASSHADLSALRRATRTAIVMPAMFALGVQVIGNPTTATFAAFGSFGMLLLADFGGTMRKRLAARASLVGAGIVLICLGTLASRNAWLSAAAMVVVGFLVLFAGVVSSVLAAASTAVLLSFILPVTLPGGAGSIAWRVGCSPALPRSWPSACCGPSPSGTAARRRGRGVPAPGRAALE
ncbi:MAG: hypothetical protein DLM58_06580 [Pseudonocardiales bacterium]|nr:MAG: hypothetical protein DLM58_06580 [Pseudonocardiales bacterium]